MIIGIMLGALLGILPTIGVLALIYDMYYPHKWLGNLCGVLTQIIFIFFGACVGCKSDIVEFNKKIENWNNTKTTLETAIRDEKISDVAKIDLVNKAIEYNMQLVSLKEDVKQWWYFYLDDEKVNKLELIDITSDSK